MKTIFEKEKKLGEALEKLKNLELKNPNLINDIKILDNQKNQLEIEKIDLEKKYNSLKEDYEALKLKLNEISEFKSDENKRELEFSEKIDELNQETNTLLEEIDKWQM